MAFMLSHLFPKPDRAHFAMKPKHKYWIFLLAIANVIFGVIVASLIGTWFTLAPEEQAFVRGILDKILPFPLLGALILFTAIGGLVSMLFFYYIIPTLQLAEKTRLITTVNPDYRIYPRGASELVYLTEVINDWADTFQKLKTEVDVKIAAAHSDLDEERKRLAALMSELPSGVVVCNTDGRILLYNAQAQKLLQAPERTNEEEAGGLLGLGRSLFGVLSRNPVAHALDLLQQSVERGETAPTAGFMTTVRGGTYLRIHMAPVFSERQKRKEISSFVLTLEDMTPQIEADTRRDTLIQSLTSDFQSALGDIRSAISAILAKPDLLPEQLEPYRRTIDQASSSLLQQLGEARKNYARHLQDLSKVEYVLAENLLEVLHKNIRERFAIEVERHAEEGLWLRLDSYSLVQAVSHLAGLLKTQKHMGAFRILFERSGPQTASMTIGWPDFCLDHGFISDWVRSPLVSDPQGKLLSFSDVVERHGGRVEIEKAGGPACHEVRIDLPTEAQAEHSLLPDGKPESRPVYYEFDLFHQPGIEELGSMPLRRLTYVVFDTETTGLNPAQGDEIIQLGAVRIVNGRLLQGETIDQLVDPRRPVPPESVAIHGIDPALLAGQPAIEEVLPHFHRFAEGAVLVAHNAAFDMRFLQLKRKITGISFDNPVLDTLLLSTVAHPHHEHHGLDHIAELMNLQIVGRHTALGDALVTAEILLRLIPLLEAKGITTLEQAISASAKSRFAKLSY